MGWKSRYEKKLILREVLENLIENAINHIGEQTAHSLIEVGSMIQDGQQIIFVRDNGQEIDLRYHNRIFNLFEALDPNTQGSGIGLTLTKHIIEVHGSRIWVESKGQGSTFYFTIAESRNH